MNEEWDYNRPLHAAQRRIAEQRGHIYSQIQGETLVLDEEELEWVMAAIYKLLRIKNHTRSRAKAMDDLVDAANYVGLLYNRWHTAGIAAKTSEEILKEKP